MKTTDRNFLSEHLFEAFVRVLQIYVQYVCELLLLIWGSLLQIVEAKS
jgi:hypothetical protein